MISYRVGTFAIKCDAGTRNGIFISTFQWWDLNNLRFFFSKNIQFKTNQVYFHFLGFLIFVNIFLCILNRSKGSRQKKLWKGGQPDRFLTVFCWTFKTFKNYDHVCMFSTNINWFQACVMYKMKSYPMRIGLQSGLKQVMFKIKAMCSPSSRDLGCPFHTCT